VFNGDIGQIESIDVIEQEIAIRVRYAVSDLRLRRTGRDIAGLRDQYSQVTRLRVSGGSHPAGDAAIHAAPTESHLYRDHAWKKLVVLAGEAKALGVAIRKNDTYARHSGLLDRLQQSGDSARARTEQG